MRRVIFLFVLLVSSFYIYSQNTTPFFSKGLIGTNKNISSSMLITIDGISFLWVRDLKKSSSNLSTKGIVYSITPQGVQIYLLVLGPIIYDGSGNKLTDVSEVAGGFSGWKFDTFLQNEKFTGFSLECYSNEDKSVTDHASIIWDPGKKAFFVDAIDRSQF